MRSVISVDMGHALTGFEADALARSGLRVDGTTVSGLPGDFDEFIEAQKDPKFFSSRDLPSCRELAERVLAGDFTMLA